MVHIHKRNFQGSLLPSWQTKQKSRILSHHVVAVKSLSRVRLFETPWTVAYQAPLSMGFSRQQYWSGLPFPSLGDLPDPGIKPRSPALESDALPSEPQGKEPIDGQYLNQTDYILCSQRWRSSIESAKTRLGADCGSYHELLIAKLRLKLKKVGKTTRPLRYDLNQIPYDYTVEVTSL